MGLIGDQLEKSKILCCRFDEVFVVVFLCVLRDQTCNTSTTMDTTENVFSVGL